MTMGLFFFQFFIRRMSQRLYGKNQHFAMLSDTVDETFLIFGRELKRCEFLSGSAERVLGISAGRLQEERMLIYGQMDRETAETIHRELYAEPCVPLDITAAYRYPRFAETRWLQLRAYRISEYGDQKYISRSPTASWSAWAAWRSRMRWPAPRTPTTPRRTSSPA
ncbi:hypothetical protein [uncultured Oscillibacter sp.]|uniref:hypothetical protein n=2 Tax=uncultured Oscillibacter sp. TaxID=876091 RepID=UPI0026005A1D|nr:hypothetical protein [uncultured Oscillibacter sp.]